MTRIRRLDRTTMLALAALFDVAHMATLEPFVAPLQLRALLWLLYRRSDRTREPYASYWRTMTEEPTGTNHAYYRSTYGRSCWAAIVRTLGAEPQRPEFETAIHLLIREHLGERDPQARARKLMMEELVRAELTREIIATKGNPHSAEARELIEQRRVAGRQPDGTSFG